MKRKALVLVVFSVFLAGLTGCASDFLTVTARGGPAVLANVVNDLRSLGPIKTSPGGFVYRNKDARLGALINEDQSVSKDVEILVQGEGNLWVPYSGPALVYTPGWIKVWSQEKKKWLWEKLLSRWLQVDGLEAIHFESAFMQSVTLRIRGDGGGTKEIMFETSGRRENGNVYERINVLFIKLPEKQYGYRLNVYSYTDQLFFKSVRGTPYTRHLSFNGDPTDYRFGNLLVGWVERL